MKKKLIKFLITSIILIVVICTTIISITKVNNNKKMMSSNMPCIKKDSNHNDHITISTYKLLKGLTNIYNYIPIIIYKQNYLLKEIKNSSFVYMQKESRKYKYLKSAKLKITESNNSLVNENISVISIINYINNHPFDYSYYLNENNLIIPNYRFFQKTVKPASNQNKFMNIINNQYYIKTNKNINMMALAYEESVIGGKKISKGQMAIFDVSMYNYSFKANIIEFNKFNNSFDFKNDTTNNKTKKLSNYNNPSILIKINNKHNFYNYQISNFISTNSYPLNFNKHTDDAFKTFYGISKIRSAGKNKGSYTLISFILTAPIVSFASIVFIYKMGKKFATRSCPIFNTIPITENINRQYTEMYNRFFTKLVSNTGGIHKYLHDKTSNLSKDSEAVTFISDYDNNKVESMYINSKSSGDNETLDLIHIQNDNGKIEHANPGIEIKRTKASDGITKLELEIHNMRATAETTTQDMKVLKISYVDEDGILRVIPDLYAKITVPVDNAVACGPDMKENKLHVEVPIKEFKFNLNIVCSGDYLTFVELI